MSASPPPPPRPISPYQFAVGLQSHRSLAWELVCVRVCLRARGMFCVMTDEGMYMTHFVGGKINKNGLERRGEKRRGGGIIKTTKKRMCFRAFSSCFPMERPHLPSAACYNGANEPGGISELTTCVCLVTLVNDPNYPPARCEQSINN